MLTWGIILGVIGFSMLGGWYFFIRDTTSHRVISVEGTSSASDFEGSLLQLYTNNVFNLEIVYRGQTHFSAIGTFEQTRSEITFHFVDAWTFDGVNLRQNPSIINGAPAVNPIQGRRIQIVYGDWILYFSA